MNKDFKMDEAFILYQREIDALIDKGYQDALAWLKEASVEFPNASVEDLLKTAESIIATTRLVSVVDADLENEDTDEGVQSTDNGSESMLLIETVIEKPVAVEIVEGGKATNDELDVVPVFNPKGDRKAIAPAGSGFEVLEGKFADEYVDDSIKLGVKHEDNEEPVHVEPDYKRHEATGFTLGGDVDISVGSKDYVPPTELIVDLSIQAPNLAPTPNEIVEEGFGGDTSIEIKNKAYNAPEELKVDMSIPEGLTEEAVPEEKKGLFSGFGKKKMPERPIAYLPPKDFDFEVDSKNPNLNLEESPVYESKNIIINEASNLERKPIEFLTPALPSSGDEDEVDEYGVPIVNAGNPISEVDYAQLQAEIAAEKRAREDAERNAQYNKYDQEASSDTVLSEEQYIQDYELSEEQRLMALRFPSRPNINSRQIIKDIRSIDVLY